MSAITRPAALHNTFALGKILQILTVASALDARACRCVVECMNETVRGCMAERRMCVRDACSRAEVKRICLRSPPTRNQSRRPFTLRVAIANKGQTADVGMMATHNHAAHAAMLSVIYPGGEI